MVEITSEAAAHHTRRCHLDTQSDDHQFRGNSLTSRKALHHIDRQGHNHPKPGKRQKQLYSTIYHKEITVDDDDDDESMCYVRSLLQLETVTSVLMICFDEKSGFQITMERG